MWKHPEAGLRKSIIGNFVIPAEQVAFGYRAICPMCILAEIAIKVA